MYSQDYFSLVLQQKVKSTMAQRDYILRMFEEMSRAIAQIIYQRQMKDYQAAHDLIDEQIRQMLGMGGSFLLALSDDALVSMLTTLGRLNTEKCWIVATLLKIEGDIYEDEQDENRSYHCRIKACNLFLEALEEQNQKKDMEEVAEVGELWEKLKDYELPLHTRQMLFWYFESTRRYDKAEDMLFDILEAESGESPGPGTEPQEMREKGEAFYARLLGKSDAALAAGNFSRAGIRESLERLHKLPM